MVKSVYSGILCVKYAQAQHQTLNYICVYVYSECRTSWKVKSYARMRGTFSEPIELVGDSYATEQNREPIAISVVLLYSNDFKIRCCGNSKMSWSYRETICTTLYTHLRNNSACVLMLWYTNKHPILFFVTCLAGYTFI